MTQADSSATGYAAAFHIYHLLGWTVMPLPRGAKLKPPEGYTGKNGHPISYADMMTWAEEGPDANVAIPLPPDVIVASSRDARAGPAGRHHVRH